MVENNVLPSQPAQPKHSRFGIASFAISLAVFIVLCIGLALTQIPYDTIMQSVGQNISPSVNAFFWGGVFGGPFGNLIGIGLGIAGFREKNRKRVFPVLGLVLNTVIIIGLCAFISFLMVMI